MTNYNSWMLALYMNRAAAGPSFRPVPVTKTKPPATNTKRPIPSTARKKLAEIMLIDLEYGAAKKK